MNILLLGNGFDLYNKLPTKYNNFLHVVNYIINNETKEFTTVGDIMSSVELQDVDVFVGECYRCHTDAYNTLLINKSKIDELAKCAKNNLWFKYLTKTFDKDVGWIDFEKEISIVVHCFEDFFKGLGLEFHEKDMIDELQKYIINEFDFFYKKTEGRTSNIGTWIPTKYSINDEFLFEYPLGSGITKVKIDEIIKYLHDQLIGLSNLLKLYLSIFVDEIINYNKDEKNGLDDALKYTDIAISLNYTNTFEKFYPDIDIYHIHGNVNDNMVLGINPDKSDDKDTINTSFVAFKKYFQRAFYDTDTAFINWIENVASDNDFYLLIMGHSLDVTDEDILKDLFDLADGITILYHNEGAKDQYIRNLINILGKDKFDKIRNEKKLEFLPLTMDFFEFSKKRAETSTILYESSVKKALEW